MALYRHEAKTRNRYHLGASFDLGFTRIKKELEAPRPKNRFLVKIGFSVKIHLYHPKGGLLCNPGQNQLQDGSFHRTLSGVCSSSGELKRTRRPPGAPGQVQDLQGHLQDMQDQLQDHV